MKPDHLDFLIAAYTVFAVLMSWDYLAPRLAWRRLLREIEARRTREQRRGSA